MCSIDERALLNPLPVPKSLFALCQVPLLMRLQIFPGRSVGSFLGSCHTGQDSALHLVCPCRVHICVAAHISARPRQRKKIQIGIRGLTHPLPAAVNRHLLPNGSGSKLVRHAALRLRHRQAASSDGLRCGDMERRSRNGFSLRSKSARS